MARDGNGSYSLPEAAFVYDTVIDETAVNSNFSDIASALTASIAKDGQTVPSANLPMGTYKHTGVGNASARDQYAAMGQVQDGAGVWCGTAGGTADAITLTPSPAITAYAAGQRFEFKAGSASNTGAVTFAISGLSTIAGQVRGAACVAGDIASNQWYRITLSDANTAQIEPLGEWINGTAIGSGKVPQWNGSAWVGATPGSGTVTSIIAGTGLTGGTITSSGTIAVDLGVTVQAYDATTMKTGATQTMTRAVRTVPFTLTDGATVTPDFQYQDFFWLIGGNRTLGVPTNMATGAVQSGAIDIRQDTTGSRTLATAWIYVWAGGTATALSTVAGSLDTLFYRVKSGYNTSTVTITIAAPGVVSWAAHGLNTGDRLQLTTTGALPTGLTASTTYWVVKNDANSFWLATSLANAVAGTKITTTGSQSGVHTAVAGEIELSLNKAFA